MHVSLALMSRCLTEETIAEKNEKHLLFQISCCMFWKTMYVIFWGFHLENNLFIRNIDFISTIVKVAGIWKGNKRNKKYSITIESYGRKKDLFTLEKQLLYVMENNVCYLFQCFAKLIWCPHTFRKQFVYTEHRLRIYYRESSRDMKGETRKNWNVLNLKSWPIVFRTFTLRHRIAIVWRQGTYSF